MDVPFARIRALYAGRGARAHARLWQRWYGSPFEAVAAYVPEGVRVADVGCGFGLFAGLLALSGDRNVTGVDIDAAKIRDARAIYARLPNLSFACGDALAVPAADCVVFYDVLHHLADADLALRAAFAALPAGGTLVVKENDTEPPLKLRVSEAVERVAVGLAITKSAPVRFRSRAEWTAAIEAAGFTVRVAEHLRTPYGFFVPHSLFVATR